MSDAFILKCCISEGFHDSIFKTLFWLEKNLDWNKKNKSRIQFTVKPGSKHTEHTEKDEQKTQTTKKMQKTQRETKETNKQKRTHRNTKHRNKDEHGNTKKQNRNELWFHHQPRRPTEQSDVPVPHSWTQEPGLNRTISHGGSSAPDRTSERIILTFSFVSRLQELLTRPRPETPPDSDRRHRGNGRASVQPPACTRWEADRRKGHADTEESWRHKCDIMGGGTTAPPLSPSLYQQHPFCWPALQQLSKM